MWESLVELTNQLALSAGSADWSLGRPMRGGGRVEWKAKQVESRAGSLNDFWLLLFYIHILRPHKLIVVLKSVLWLFQRKVLLRFYTRCVFFTEYKYFKPILFNCDSIFTGTLRSTDNFYGKIRVLRSRKQVPVLMKLFRIITYAFDFGFQ